MELKELFLEKLQELASTEQLLVANLPDLITASFNRDLHSIFSTHLKQTEDQSRRIDQAFGSLGIKPCTRPCRPMGALIAEASQISVKRAPGTVRDLAILDIALRIEHSEIAAYLSLIALAQTLNYATAAKLLTQNLEEEQHTAQYLQQIGATLLESTPATT